MSKSIVVGVDPTREHDAALEFAVAQARRRGLRVHLVVVMHPGHPGPDQVLELKLVGDELLRVDHDLLVRCERRIAEWDDDVVVTTEIAHGAVVPSLVAAAGDAEMLVLGHHRMSRPHHLPTLSVTHGIAARTSCPVYAVPDDWHELRDHPEPVLAAVEDAWSGRAVAAAAFAEARLAGSALRVVRAWCYPDLDLDEESVLHGTGHDDAAALARATTEELAELVAAYRDVPCQVDAVHGQAAYTLSEASRHARLLVIGRHRPSLPWGSHLGPVTRSVVGPAHCPVVVVDTRPDPAYAVTVDAGAPAQTM
jgi:nucleotide-binding universal stress UspA family protein